MKNLSLWGKNHKKMSYFIIIFSAIFLNTSFGIMGLSLEMDNINIPVFVTCALFVVLAITALLYPHKQKNSVNQADSYYNSYAKRKFCDFVMFSATALLALCLVNQESASLTIEENQENQLNSGIEQDNTVFRYVSNVEIPTETSTNTSTSTSAKTETSTQNTVSNFDEKKPTLAKSRKEMRKMLKKYIKEIKSKLKSKNNDNGLKVLLTILAILLMIVILYAAVLVSCSFSCSGNGTAAVLVLLLGLGLEIGIVVLLVRMWRKKKDEEEEEEEEDEATTLRNKKNKA